MELMKKRLQATLDKYQELINLLSQEEIINDFDKYKELSKEQSDLEETALLYKKYLSVEEEKKDLINLSKDKDHEIAQFASQELEYVEIKLEELIIELRQILTPKDPYDNKNIIFEIRGAAGGDEANIFAGDLFRMYTRYAEEKRWKVEIIDSLDEPMGGISYVSFLVKGKGAYSRLKYESGAHRVQRVPKTEAQGRVHTSTATVLVMPQADEVDVTINPSDLKIDVFRSSGAGGQHVNTTDSAVRITHLPTNTVVECQDGRSQHDNKNKAMLILRTRILDKITQEADELRNNEIRTKLGTGDRAEKIRTYNYPQNRVSDHRINYTSRQLNKIIDGDLDPLIDSLINEMEKMKIEQKNEF